MDSKIILDSFTNSILELENNLPTGIKGNIEPYTINYLYNHVDAIVEDFKVCKIALGQDNLEYFAREFLKSHPPKQPNLDEFGKDFPNFIKTSPELQEMPFLRDLASIDLMFAYTLDIELQCGRGSLDLWSCLREDRDIPEGIYDESSLEMIRWIRQDSKLLMIAQNIE